MMLLALLLLAPLHVDVNTTEFSVTTTQPTTLRTHDCPCTVRTQHNDISFSCTTLPTCTVTLDTNQNNVLLTYAMTVNSTQAQSLSKTAYNTPFPLKLVVVCILITAALLYASRKKVYSIIIKDGN